MSRRMPTGVRSLAVCAALAALLPGAAAAQLGPGQRTGWPPAEIGVRVGFDNVQRQEVLGALVRIPILRNGSVELVPNADVTFLRGIKEYQLNAEAVYLWLSDDGGLYAGGGIGLRNTIPPTIPPGGRETITTFSLVVGLKLTGLERVNPMVEFRRVFASDLAVDPQLISIGVTLELW